MNRKAQSALEFLMTYGWAILIILIAIAALAYFGVLTPSRLLPARCTFSPEVGCEEFSIESPATVRFRFKNNIGTSADFTVTLSSVDGFGTSTCTPPPQPYTVGAGKIQEVTCTLLPGGMPAEEKLKFLVDMTYKKTGGQYDVPLKGEIYGQSK